MDSQPFRVIYWSASDSCTYKLIKLQSLDCGLILLFCSLKVMDMTNLTCHTQLFIYTQTGDREFPGWNLCDSPQHRQDYPLDGTPYHLASRRGKWIRIWYKGNAVDQRPAGFKIEYDFRGEYLSKVVLYSLNTKQCDKWFLI